MEEKKAEIGGGGTGDFTVKGFAEKRASRCSSNEHILFSPLLSGANVATHSVPESEIHGDNISCVRRSGGTNVATGENGDRDRKDESHCLTSDDSVPVDEKVVTCTCFDKAGCNHCDVPNFTEELPLVEGEPFECSSHSSQKNDLRQSVALINNTRMQESQQSQPGNHSNVSDLMDDWVKVCDTCGAVGDESLLVSCNKCTDGAEHTYCMRVKLFEKPKSWTCQDCAPRAGTNKLVEDDVEVGARSKTGHLTKRSINLESSKGAKFSSGSSYPRKSSTIGVSSTTHLSGDKIHISTVAQSDEKRRARKLPSNKLGKAKLGAAGSLSAGSLLKSNSSKAANLKPKGQNAKAGCLQKQKVERNPAFHDDRKGKGPIAVSKSMTSESAFLEESNATGSKVVLADAYELSNSPMPLLASDSTVTTEKSEKETNSGAETLADGLELNNPPMPLLASDSAITTAKNEEETVSGGETLADAYELNNPLMSSFASDSAVTAENNEKEIISAGETLADAYELNNSPVSFLASYSAVTAEKNEKETSPGGETLFSGSHFCNLDVVGSSRQLDHRSHASIHNTHKDSNCTNIKKKNVSQQAEHPATGLVFPNVHPSWLGKFMIHKSEGIARNCDGFQAHLSSCASREVPDKLPEIIILEELPRLRIWPSQFIRSQVTEENISLYFFPKDVDSDGTDYRGLINCMINNDLALKGNLDGAELLIFPSNILPKRSQLWNQNMFLWGVFNAQVVNNSANTPVSNSVKQGNGDTVKRREFDLNAYPEDEDDDAGVNLTVQQGNGDTVKKGTIDLSACTEDENVDAGVNLAVEGRSTTPENGSVRTEHHVKELPTSL
ncbi:uncharacterized protein LOC130740958 isoform X2 [Lotus japonicus]|uniref:uncharacterized protein LOC130740958 isoform X2 n=1 Tax=Lotus japonicus TaxID=34305 RepID=UPI00258CBC81|nr:uncharacterized protein LOC130740958 isoform X2 [Lotus japonicus]